MAGESFFQRLKQGLTKSRENLLQNIGSIFQNRRWDEESLDAMEESLIAADVGVKATDKLMEALRRQSPDGNGDIAEEMSARLQASMIQMLQESASPPKLAPLSARPWVILFLGVNGVGKTTTIGKLAAQYRSAGKKFCWWQRTPFALRRSSNSISGDSALASMSSSIAQARIRPPWFSTACKPRKAAA
jgi:Signal recognition particle GTPase